MAASRSWRSVNRHPKSGPRVCLAWKSDGFCWVGECRNGGAVGGGEGCAASGRGCGGGDLQGWVQSPCAAPSPSRRLETQAARPPPVPGRVQVGEITEEELRQYDGSDPEKPLLMAIKGQIYASPRAGCSVEVAMLLVKMPVGYWPRCPSYYRM